MSKGRRSDQFKHSASTQYSTCLQNARWRDGTTCRKSPGRHSSHRRILHFFHNDGLTVTPSRANPQSTCHVSDFKLSLPSSFRAAGDVGVSARCQHQLSNGAYNLQISDGGMANGWCNVYRWSTLATWRWKKGLVQIHSPSPHCSIYAPWSIQHQSCQHFV